MTSFHYFVALATSIVLSVSMAATMEARFVRLSGQEIQSQIVRRTIPDLAHWSEHFLSGGQLKAMELGVMKAGA